MNRSEGIRILNDALNRETRDEKARKVEPSNDASCCAVLQVTGRLPMFPHSFS